MVADWLCTSYSIAQTLRDRYKFNNQWCRTKWTGGPRSTSQRPRAGLWSFQLYDKEQSAQRQGARPLMARWFRPRWERRPCHPNTTPTPHTARMALAWHRLVWARYSPALSHPLTMPGSLFEGEKKSVFLNDGVKTHGRCGWLSWGGVSINDLKNTPELPEQIYSYIDLLCTNIFWRFAFCHQCTQEVLIS